LADKDIAEAVKGAAYEGYEQKSGKRTAIFRVL
jgi:hypothetical protein